jgi:hypothetical protein
MTTKEYAHKNRIQQSTIDDTVHYLNKVKELIEKKDYQEIIKLNKQKRGNYSKMAIAIKLNYFTSIKDPLHKRPSVYKNTFGPNEIFEPIHARHLIELLNEEKHNKKKRRREKNEQEITQKQPQIQPKTEESLPLKKSKKKYHISLLWGLIKYNFN